MKLAKKNDQAVLSFEIKARSGNGRSAKITQDVRIDVKKASVFNEPMCPEPDVCIFTCFFSKVGLTYLVDPYYSPPSHQAADYSRSNESYG